jgi:hypothetical protein
MKERWTFRDEYLKNFFEELLTDAKLEEVLSRRGNDISMWAGPEEVQEVKCDLEFSIQSDYSSSESYLKYYNFDTKTTETQHFRESRDFGLLRFYNNGECTNIYCEDESHENRCPWSSAQILLMEVFFDPYGSATIAHHDEWWRNKYTMIGSHYIVQKVRMPGYMYSQGDPPTWTKMPLTTAQPAQCDARSGACY